MPVCRSCQIAVWSNPSIFTTMGPSSRKFGFTAGGKAGEGRKRCRGVQFCAPTTSALRQRRMTVKSVCQRREGSEERSG